MPSGTRVIMHDDLKISLKKLIKREKENTFLNHLYHYFFYANTVTGKKYDNEFYCLWKPNKNLGPFYPVYKLWIHDKIIIETSLNKFGNTLSVLFKFIFIYIFFFLCFQSYNNNQSVNYTVTLMVVLGVLFYIIYIITSSIFKYEKRQDLENLIKYLNLNPENIETNIDVFINTKQLAKSNFWLRVLIYFISALFGFISYSLLRNNEVLASLPFLFFVVVLIYYDIVLHVFKQKK